MRKVRVVPVNAEDGAHHLSCRLASVKPCDKGPSLAYPLDLFEGQILGKRLGLDEIIFRD
jgi:hypothetical protein